MGNADITLFAFKLIGQEQTVQVVEMVLGWLQLIKEQLPHISRMSDLFASELAIHACYLAGPEVKSLAEILQDRSDQNLGPQFKQRLVNLFKRSVAHTVRNGVAWVFKQNPLGHSEAYSVLVAEIFGNRYAGVTEWVTDWVQARNYDARVTDVVSKYEHYRLAIPGEKQTTRVYKDNRFTEHNISPWRPMYMQI